MVFKRGCEAGAYAGDLCRGGGALGVVDDADELFTGAYGEDVIGERWHEADDAVRMVRQRDAAAGFHR